MIGTALRWALAPMAAGALLLLGCQDEPITGILDREGEEAAVHLAWSSRAEDGEPLITVAIQLPQNGAEISAMQGRVRFDPEQLAYVGQKADGPFAAMVNPTEASRGQLRFVSVAFGEGGDRVGVFTFRGDARAVAGMVLTVEIAVDGDGDDTPVRIAPPVRTDGLLVGGVARALSPEDWLDYLDLAVGTAAGSQQVLAAGVEIGDCNQDFWIDARDVLQVARMAVGLLLPPDESLDLRLCDVDRSGVVDARDVLDVRRFAVGLLPVRSRPSVYGPMAPGDRFACAFDQADRAYCWGANELGQRGNGTRFSQSSPTLVSGSRTLSQITAGGGHACAVDLSGSVWCWGSNGSGQVGADPIGSDALAPVAVAVPAVNAIAAGGSHTCALDASGDAGATAGGGPGQIHCWGANGRGQLGDGSTTGRAAPDPVAGARRFFAVTVGAAHSCGIAENRQAWCWGANDRGQLGVTGTEDRRSPVAVQDGHTFVALAAGDDFTCGLTETGTLMCWGANDAGQLGDGSTTDRDGPTSAPGSYVDFAAGNRHACALDASGQAFCWGANQAGQLGVGSTVPAATPAPVIAAAAGPVSFGTVGAGADLTCGLEKMTRQLFCWGGNDAGQVGDGTRTDRGIPTPTLPLAPAAGILASIDRPGEGTTFRAGDEVVFTGGATDAEDRAIPAERLTWWIDLHHDEHAHPFLTPTAGIDSSTVQIPTRGETDDNIWYRIYLEATDLQSTPDTVYRDIFPEKSTLTFQTEPPGLRITLDGMSRVTPVSVLAVEGLERDIGVVTPQTLDGQSYAFDAWTHGGVASQTVVTPTGDSTFVATFGWTGTNQPPTVSLTAPASGTTVTVGTEVAVTAGASDTDGAVVLVDFFAEGTLFGSDDAAPYSVQWTPSTAGVYRLTARVTDNGGALEVSDTVRVDVVSAGGGDVTPPSIQLTAPADQATELTGVVVLRATASDDVGVAAVQFQIDGEDVGGEVTSEPYEVELFSTSVYASGVHVVRARARDAAGNLSAWSSATVTFGGSEALPQGFVMSPYGASLPGLGTNLAFAPDGRLFVTLKYGAIRIISDGQLLSQEFARLTVDDDGERGLLGVAFHPDFATNGWVYVHYLTTDGGAGSHARLARFTANGDVASGAEEVLVTFPTDESQFHNGGEIHFGPDGKLYVALGDDVTPANSQSLATVFGKLLRFNDDGSIPSDNPFYGSTTGLNRSIWALGLRNPFTFAFQPGTGRVFINDVGGFRWEEINEGFRGANYGWPESEGPTGDPRFVSPLYSYEPYAGPVRGSSIVGAAFYDPPVPRFPSAYNGQYFFGDYTANWIHRLDPENGNAVYRFASVPAGVTGLAVGPDGALYVLVANSFTSAQVHRIAYLP